MYTVVGSRTNRTFRVLWALEELGIEYDHKPYSVRSPEALEHSPTGKLPALIAEGEVITDSAAIITFLADRHGGLIFPAGSVQRAKQDALLHRVNDEIDAVLWTAARHSFILPEVCRRRGRGRGAEGGPQWLQQSAGPPHQFPHHFYWFLYTFLHRSAGKPQKILKKSSKK